MKVSADLVPQRTEGTHRTLRDSKGCMIGIIRKEHADSFLQAALATSKDGSPLKAHREPSGSDVKGEK